MCTKFGEKMAIFKARDIKDWDVQSSADGNKWIPARPMFMNNLHSGIRRSKAAWMVLIGKFDALDWEDSK